jgi:hypothetical protein
VKTGVCVCTLRGYGPSPKPAVEIDQTRVENRAGIIVNAFEGGS